jgi:hypothetical protein
MDVTSAVLTACGGFLLAVLWMDLMFDVQVLGHRGADTLPEPALASIAGYYHRATTTARPMNRLIALVMVTLLATLVFRAVRAGDPAWLLIAAFVMAGGPITLAAVHTVPAAVRLGERGDTSADQTRLARSICRDHLICLAGIAAFVTLWLAEAAAS